MKRFNVTVNGVKYDVCVEEVGGVSAPVAAPVSAPAPTAAPAPVSAPVTASAGTAAQGATKVLAPMPGTILRINAKVGASVKSGDVLCVLEAMKMENDICAPCDGTVASVNVSQGASVNTDELIITLN